MATMGKKRKASSSSYHDSEMNKDEQNENPSTIVKVDRYVTELPDIVVHQILLILTLVSPKLGAQASLVSKQWASIWFLLSLPVLAYEEYDQKSKPNTDHESRRNQFTDFANTYLKRWEKDKRGLHKLRLRMKYSGTCRAIQKCLSFAAERNVKEIDISFIRESIDGQRRRKTFFLSLMTLNSVKSLTMLKLENVKLRWDNSDAVISLPSLKTMSLEHLRCDMTFFKLISRCRSLENLLLNSCFGFCGVLSSSSLKSLEVMRCKLLRIETENPLEFVVVEAENLESVKLDGNQLIEISTSCERVRTVEFTERIFSSKHYDYFYSRIPLLESLILKRRRNPCIIPIANQHRKRFVCFGAGLFWCKLTMNFPNQLEAIIIAPADIISRKGKWCQSRLILLIAHFDCCKKLSLHFNKVEDVILPVKMRSKWSSPLPTLEHLQVEISNTSTIAMQDSVLMDSLRWMAPSSKISICNKITS